MADLVVRTVPGDHLARQVAARTNRQPSGVAMSVQLAVDHFDHQTRYYPVNGSWRIDAASRCIVIGKGLPRTHIPLDNVAAWRIERVPTAEPVTP